LEGAARSHEQHFDCRSAARAEAVRTEARRAGANIIATVAEHAEPLSVMDLRRPTLLLVGNEGAGLPSRSSPCLTRVTSRCGRE
jgi:tRNA G18 (ribose-2'-O)-methylase SpoU